MRFLTVLGTWKHVKVSAVPQQEGAELSSHPTSMNTAETRWATQTYSKPEGLLSIPCISNHEET